MSFTCDRCEMELTPIELVGGSPVYTLSGVRFVGGVEILHFELCRACFDLLAGWIQTRTGMTS